MDATMTMTVDLKASLISRLAAIPSGTIEHILIDGPRTVWGERSVDGERVRVLKTDGDRETKTPWIDLAVVSFSAVANAEREKLAAQAELARLRSLPPVS